MISLRVRDSGVEVLETGFVVICPFYNVIKPDRESVDSGQRSKVVKVRQKVVRSGDNRITGVELLSVLEETSSRSTV